MSYFNKLQEELYAPGSGAEICSSEPGFLEKNAGSIAKSSGIIPCYEKCKDIVPDETIYYSKDGEISKKYVSRAISEIKKFFGERIGMAPYYEGLRVGIQKLPAKYASFKARTKQGIKEYIVPISKVFGFYSPDTDVMAADEVVHPEINTPEKKIWKKRPSALSTYMHELLHGAQQRLGILDRYNRMFGPEIGRYFIEGQAETLAREISGENEENGIYLENRVDYKRLEKMVGKKAALTGCFDPSAVLGGKKASYSACTC